MFPTVENHEDNFSRDKNQKEVKHRVPEAGVLKLAIF